MDGGARYQQETGGTGVSRAMCGWLIPALLALEVCLVVALASASPAAHEFAAIDAHALAAPASATGSISSLSAYLVKPARNESECARAIFRWITARIAYDTSAASEGLDPDLVLSRRRAACMGYASLFKALAKEAGLKAETIVGHVKRVKPEMTGGPDLWENHAWNAVEIAGHWQLVDCCWGAGHCNERGRFTRKFTPHYFLTAPDVFIYNHFPNNPRWQLLARPLSRAEFLRRVEVGPTFFDCGLRLVSHPSRRIDAAGSVALTIGAPPDTFLIASLYQNGQELGEQCTFTQRCAEGFAIRALFPSQGDYVLRIFARRGDDASADYHWALDYAVHARSGNNNDGGFPMAYDPFLTHNCRLEGPLSRTLQAGKSVEVSLNAPDAEDVVVVTGDSWKHLPTQRSRFRGEIPVPSGDFVIFAKFASESAYEGILRYTGQ